MKKSSGIGCEPTTASQISRHSRTFLQVMLNKPMKIFSFLLGDLRLYEYHKRNYEGELGKMMSLIRHLENQQWEMMKFDGYSDKIDKIVDDMPSYADYSNKKFMEL